MIRLFVFGLLLSASLGLHASYLFWQVSPYMSGDNIDVVSGDEGDVYQLAGKTIYGARMMVSTDGGKTYQENSPYYYSESEYYDDVLAEYDFAWEGREDTPTGLNVVISDENPTYLYYIELVGYDSRFGDDPVAIGSSEIKTYAELLDAGYISYQMSDTGLHAWTGGTYVVPEPTSALLLILGFGALGLKRRNERV